MRSTEILEAIITKKKKIEPSDVVGLSPEFFSFALRQSRNPRKSAPRKSPQVLSRCAQVGFISRGIKSRCEVKSVQLPASPIGWPFAPPWITEGGERTKGGDATPSFTWVGAAAEIYVSYIKVTGICVIPLIRSRRIAAARRGFSHEETRLRCSRDRFLLLCISVLFKLPLFIIFLTIFLTLVRYFSISLNAVDFIRNFVVLFRRKLARSNNHDNADFRFWETSVIIPGR